MYLLKWPIKKLRNWLWIEPPAIVSEDVQAPPPQRLVAKHGGKFTIRLALGDARASIAYEGGKEFFSSGAGEQSTSKKTKKKQLSDGGGKRSDFSDRSSGKGKQQQYYLCPDVHHEEHFTEFDQLLEHMELIHVKDEWSVCKTCQRVSLSNRVAKGHRRRRKGHQEPSSSSSSGGKGSSAGVLGLIAGVGERFVCPVDQHLNKAYSGFNEFVHHIKHEHGDEYWGMCNRCELVFVCRMIADHHKKETAHSLLENEGGVELKQGGLASI